MTGPELFREVSMYRRAVLCSVWLAPLVGCNLIRTSTHNVTNEYRVDHGDEVIVKRMRRDADDVLREICQRHPKRAFTKEFREGFKDGYVDYLDSGGPVRPPVAPTARFRGPKYLSPEGHCLMRDYILGFEYGGNVAQSTGRRQFFMVPMLISEEPKPPALNITVLPNPPEGLSDEKDKPKEKIPDTRPLSPSTQPPAGPGPTGTPTPSTAPTSPTPTTPMSTTPSPITPAPMTPSPAPMTPTPAPKSSAISTMPAAALPATPMPIPMTPAAAAPMPELPKVVIPAVEVPAPVVVPKVMPLPLPQPTPLPTPTPSTKPMPTPAAPANPPTTTALPGSIAVPAVSSWRPWPTRPSVNTQPNTDIIPVSGTAPADAPPELTMTRWSLGLIFPAMLAAAFGSGCAAVSNPIADGIPVRRIPQEMLGRSKADLQTVPLTLLKLKEEEEYRLDKHDVLAVIAGDLFGPENVQPPVNFTDPRDPNVTGESSVGYPVPVRDDGTISMPNARIPPIQVKGLTAREVEVKLRDLLTNGPNSKFFPKPEEGGGKIAVQLLRKRRVVVTVIREDTQGIPVTAGSSGTVTSSARRLGQPVSLEGGHNDLLRALNQTGGPPGLDAKNEVYIYRGQYDPANPTKGQTRVPLKIYPDEPLQISQADITLNEGDIVLIPGRDAEVFYTGGVLGARQVVLPRDYDLDVVQAISLTGGPIVNGGFTQTAFNAQSFASGIGTPSPALCNITRRLNDGRQLNIRIDLTRALRDPRERVIMMPNDLLVVQEKPLEAIDRYFYQVFRFNTTIQSILGESIFQTITSTLP